MCFVTVSLQLCCASSSAAVAVFVSVNDVTVAEIVRSVVSVSSAVTVAVIAHLLAVSLSQLCDRNDKHTQAHPHTHQHIHMHSDTAGRPQPLHKAC